MYFLSLSRSKNWCIEILFFKYVSCPSLLTLLWQPDNIIIEYNEWITIEIITILLLYNKTGFQYENYCNFDNDFRFRVERSLKDFSESTITRRLVYNDNQVEYVKCRKYFLWNVMYIREGIRLSQVRRYDRAIENGTCEVD